MKLRLLLSVLAPLLLSASLACADGCYIPKIAPGSVAQDLTEPTQKALLVHFEGKERLVLQVTFKGNVREFAWLIPTPSRPKLRAGNSYLFEGLHNTTASRIRYWFEADELLHGLLMTFAGSRVKTAGPSGVEVLEKVTVGGYKAAVLHATNS